MRKNMLELRELTMTGIVVRILVAIIPIKNNKNINNNFLLYGSRKNIFCLVINFNQNFYV